MANDAKFNFYLNRQGARGQKGEKGDPGFSPSITVNTDTADEYTLLIQNEYDSFVTDNIRPTYDDRGGTYVRVDRANNVQYFGSADIATTANYGEVKLAQASDLASTVDVGNSNVITAELLKTWFDGQVADNLVTTTNNVTIQGQKIFATPTRFTDTVRIGNRLVVTQEDTGTITFDTDETGTLIGTDATFKKDVRVYGGAGIDGNLRVNGVANLRETKTGPLYVGSGLTVQTGGVKVQDGELDATGNNTITKNLLLSPGSLKRVNGFSSHLRPDSSEILPEEYITVGDERLPLRLVGTKVLANGKDVATTDTVDAIQTDLNIAKQDIVEAQGDIDNLQMNKQNKLTAGTGITIDADNVISATGGVLDLPIASNTTLGGIKVGENLTISEDGTLSATGGGSGDVSAAGNNTFTGENTFNGAVNLNGTNIAENLTVTGNLTSSGEINAVSIKTTGLRSDDIKTTANKKYLTEVDVDNQTIQVVDGKISSTTPITYVTRAEYDALATKDVNTMYVITDEEGGGGSSVTYTAEAPLSISADNVISIDTTGLGGTTLKKDVSISVDYALDLHANRTVGGTSKAARAESNEANHDPYKAFSGHNPSDATSTLWGPNRRKTGSWVELYLPDGVVPYSAAWTYGSTGEILPAVELLASNDGSSYTSLGSVTGVSTVTASMTFNTTDSYKYLRFKFRDACVSNWGKFGLTSLKVKSSEMTTYTELLIGDNIDVTNGVMNVNSLSGEVTSLTGEVNTLSGEVAGLSGDITTLQNNMNSKQDKLTAGEGLNISEVYTPIANNLIMVNYPDSVYAKTQFNVSSTNPKLGFWYNQGYVRPDTSITAMENIVKYGSLLIPFEKNFVYVLPDIYGSAIGYMDGDIFVPFFALAASNKYFTNYDNTTGSATTNSGLLPTSGSVSIDRKHRYIVQLLDNAFIRTSNKNYYKYDISGIDFIQGKDLFICFAQWGEWDSSGPNLYGLHSDSPLKILKYDQCNIGKFATTADLTTDAGTPDANAENLLDLNNPIKQTVISSTTPITYLTRAQYDALETKDANTMYVITDEEGGGGGTGDIPIATTTTAGKVKPDGTTITITDDGTISAVGGGGTTIDDSTTSGTSTWSSSKINSEIVTKYNELLARVVALETNINGGNA